MAFGASVVARCALLLVSCSAVLGGPAIDLTHTFDSTTLYYDSNAPPFMLDSVAPPIHGVAEFKFSARDHGGTVMEAPARYNAGLFTIDQIPPKRLIYIRAAVIDIENQTIADEDYLLTVADLADWKLANGDFVYPTIVLAKTGCAQFWPDRQLYFRESGGVYHFPGISEDAAQVLADNPAVLGVGIDTASICGGIESAAACAAHQKIADANKFTIENLADMSAMFPAGGRITAVPVKIGGGGTAAPVRVLADPAPSGTSCPGNSNGQGNGGGHNHR